MGAPRARLARLGRHIRPPAAGASAAPSTPWLERLAERVASLPEADKRGRRFDLNGSGGHQLPLPSDVVPLGVDESADGQLRALPSELQRVRAAAATAEAAGDEREAAVLRDLLHVVEPKPELSLADCCPTSVEACAAFFRREGFVCMRSVVSGEKLRDIQVLQQLREIAQREGRDVTLGPSQPAAPTAARGRGKGKGKEKGHGKG